MDELEARRQDVMRAAGEPIGFASTWDETLQVLETLRASAETATHWCDKAHGYRMDRDRAVTALKKRRCSRPRRPRGTVPAAASRTRSTCP